MADIAAVTSIEITAHDRTKGALDSVTGGLSRLGGAAGAVTGALGALGVSLSIAAFAAAVKAAIDYADRLNDLSKATGISVEMLGGLGYAAEQSGTSLDAVAKGTSKLATLMAEAAAGSANASKLFDAMGASVRGLDGNLKPLDKMLLEVADKFASYKDGPEKAAFANAMFGERLGAQMIPLLNEGAKKLQEMREEFERYGGVTGDTAARADAFNDTLSKIQLMGSALWRTLASALLPTLQAVANIFVEAKEKAGGFNDVGDLVVLTFKGMVITGMATVEAFRAVGGAISAVLDAARLWFQGGSLDSVKSALTEGFGDVRESIVGTITNISKVWDASTATIAASAHKNLNQGAAPATKALGEAAKKTGDGFKEMAAAINRAYEDAMNWVKAGEEIEAQQRAADEAYADAILTLRDLLDAQQEEIDAYDAQTAAIGKTRQELAAMEVARQAEIRDLRLMAGWGQEAIDIYDKWAAAIQRREVVTAQQESTQEMVRLWQSVDRAAEDAFTNILQGGKNAFERLKDSLLNGLYALLYQMTVRPFIINIATQLTGNSGLAGLMGGGGGGGAGGGLGGVGDIFSLLGGGGGLLSGTSGLSAGLATTFGNGALALGFTETAGAFAAFGSMLGTAIPIIGAVLAIAALAGAFDKEPSQVQGRFGVQPGPGGFEDNASLETMFGNIGFLDEGTKYFSGEAAQVFNKIIADTLGALGSRLDPAGQERLAQRLQGMDFGSFEGEYTTQEFIEKYGAEIMGKVIQAGLEELDPALAAVFAAFEGTADEMAEFANVLLTVHDLTLAIPTELRETLIAALDGTVEMSEQVIAFAAAYSLLQDVMNRDPVEDALNAIAEASDSAYTALMKQADAFGELITAYDGSTEASTEIAEATAAYYASLVNVIAGIRQLGQSIEQMFAGTIEDMTLETLTDDEKKLYYQGQIAGLYSQLSGATDPAEIERITRQINDYMRAAFGLLTPDEQVNLLQQYADYARQVSELAQERLVLAEGGAQARADALFLQLRDVMTSAANDFAKAALDQKSAATEAKSAANTMLQAANTPLVIVIPERPVNA